MNNKRHNNLKIVGLSVLGATIFWFFSAFGKNYSYRIKCPVDLVYATDSLILVQAPTKYVDLDVAGVGWDLFRYSFWFSTQPILFQVREPDKTTFFTKDHIRQEAEDQLRQFNINYVYTDSITFDLDWRTEKKVALVLDSAAIDMEEGYRIVSPITVVPDSITIHGPESFIDTLKSEWTFTLDYEQIDKSFDRYVMFGLPEAYQIYAEPGSANVFFDVDEFLSLEEEITIEALHFPYDSSAYLAEDKVKVMLTISQQYIDSYDRDDFKIVVDYNMVNHQDSLAPTIVLFYPEHVSEMSTLPDSLRVIYEK